ncbi:hypothetical protein TRFO_09604 [Tritrichomonas foetus]|uniref:Uncharacterized protein n=1 Tax=Tritrichomonas foetus TaxID=1144522 RepID=A0A1J4JD07_9EUKA|nr:hypothetical protein TRFO_09604 [Tritrichomonas foetus]|eukprot:OHS97070.1 hypothetical protein TRFO_09604 [Tritrichomonas foetus]
MLNSLKIGDFSVVPTLENFINRQRELPFQTMIELNIIPFFVDLISNFVLTDQNASLMASLLHIFALLTQSRSPIFNNYINRNFITKLIGLISVHSCLIFSLWSISNLISVSDFIFEIFLDSQIFSILTPLCSNFQSKEILVLCSVIHKRSVKRINHKVDLSIYIQNIQTLILSNDEVVLSLCMKSISKLINSEANFINIDFYKSVIQNIFLKFALTTAQYSEYIRSHQNATSNSFLNIQNHQNIEDASKNVQENCQNDLIFGSALNLLISLLSTDNPEVYELLRQTPILPILVKGMTFPNPTIQEASIQAVCLVIVNMPNYANEILQSGVLEIIFLTVNDGDFKCKKAVTEALCRIIYQENYKILHLEIFNRGGIAFLIDTMINMHEIMPEILDVLYFIKVTYPDLVPVMVESGLIDNLNEIIAGMNEDDEINENVFNKAQVFFEELIEIASHLNYE